MDVVYPYRATKHDFELKFSLRSLVNVEHGRVIVAGDKPRVTNSSVLHVPTFRGGSRYASSTQNIAAAVQRVETDSFIVMNDDIFVLEPWTFRHENRGPVEAYIASGGPKGDYLAHLVSTSNMLKAHGVSDPLFFGLHTPTVYDRARLLGLVKEFKGKRYLLRTLYHNLFPQPSIRRDDVKVRAWTGETVEDVLSISDECARAPAFVDWISARFPNPSPYEAAERRNVAA